MTAEIKRKELSLRLGMIVANAPIPKESDAKWANIRWANQAAIALNYTMRPTLPDWTWANSGFR